MTHTLTLYKARKGEWRWRLKRKRGGKIVADSGEGYKTRAGADRAVGRLPLSWENVTCKFEE